MRKYTWPNINQNNDFYYSSKFSKKHITAEKLFTVLRGSVNFVVHLLSFP